MSCSAIVGASHLQIYGQILPTDTTPPTPIMVNTKNIVQEHLTKTAMGDRETGFPEPLSPDRNTTLPHPDADTSENATIEAPDIALERRNSRRSLRIHRHHSSMSGKLTLEETMRYDNITYADGTKEKNSPAVIQTDIEKRDDIGDPPKGGVKSDSAVSLGQTQSIDERDAQGYKEGDRTKGILRKLQLHKVI
ncbi:hypothetical protein B0O99DRAFT_620037 [Bisporella sp. PMI_857]|nr:hypothetical protein B0O99DRAFT_620037 [Bisporella sp. PMI_857]